MLLHEEVKILKVKLRRLIIAEKGNALNHKLLYALRKNKL